MKPLFGLAHEVQSFCEKKDWQFCFIGGLALQRWGENRLTVDIDISLFSGFGQEEEYVSALLKEFQPRRDVALGFALSYRVLLLRSAEGIGIYVSLAAVPFEKEIVDRSSVFEFLPGCALRTCSAEDLIVLKAFASRPQDWVDIRGILIRQGASLALEPVHNRLKPLVDLKEEPEILTKLDKLIREVRE